MPGSSQRRSPSRRLLLLTFGLLALGVVAATIFSVARTQDVERHASLLVENSLTSVRLVDRMTLDVVRERIQIWRHVHETSTEGMQAIEEERQRLAADRQASAAAYERLTTLQGEGQIWDQVRAKLSTLDAHTERLLALSRQNRDAEARVLLMDLIPRFDSLQLDLESLSSLNSKAAFAGLEQIRSIRTELIETDVGLGILGLIGVVLIGWWAVREVERRDRVAGRERRQLEQRNRELDAFAGRVAHDIRGPLGIISLAAGRLSSADRATAGALRRGVARMNALIEDLLVLARVETLRESCDPAVVSADLEAEVASRVSAENGALHVSVEHASVRCSDGLLRQVLDNLLDNALKYRKPEISPEIEVAGATEGGEYRLKVTDNGMGMSQEDADRVFEPFFRSPLARGRPGTGLGLSIVKRVADASGGTVSVDSSPGRGTSFLLCLPLTKGGGDVARPAPGG